MIRTLSGTKNILVISLSNIGDVILTLPVIDTLKENFPGVRISVVVGPKATELINNDFSLNPIVYDKRLPLKAKIGFWIYLRKQKFDAIIDLRHSGFALFLKAAHKTSAFLKVPKAIEHAKYRHLYKLKSTLPKIGKFYSLAEISTNQNDREKIDKLLEENKIAAGGFVAVSAGAASHWKRYKASGFAKVCDYLADKYRFHPVRSAESGHVASNGVKIVMVGDKNDIGIVEDIASQMKNKPVNFAGQTNLRELAYLLKKAKLVISNDSGVMHLASYLDVPTLAIFGPTDPKKYGPWNYKSLVVREELTCSPCEESSCRYNHHNCMNLLSEDKLIKLAEKILLADTTKEPLSVSPSLLSYKRVLIVRTDRIGDVILSTPAIRAVKDFYPNSFVAVMVSPYAKEIIEGNPYADEVIIYDKDKVHKSVFASIRFANQLKKRKFDLAIILHPTNRVNLVSYFARIPERVGYNRKMGFLLTKKLDDKKHLGEKHEMEYSLDVIRAIGIESKEKELFMPIKLESENWLEDMLAKNRILNQDRLIAIHPAASCPSKIWPQESFAKISDKLIEAGYKIIVVAGPKDKKIANKVAEKISYPVLNLAGDTSVSHLASILKRCKLFISNDSGPVHIASAVGTPVISIFGRNQKGLSPLRWGPLGIKDKFLHKDVGCIECLAHNCKKEFTCLKAIKVEDVLKAVEEILK
ncbi:MAG: lipopolysaccharide heptosyltransferase II [Candidatus Omnitrophica bacterium]|nr:lipopolysaccharide heptosyltransferase II [Candidatus Omnitrophota bacterium]